MMRDAVRAASERFGDDAARWVGLRAEVEAAGYSHVGLDGGTDGWIDHVSRELFTDSERDAASELAQLARLVEELHTAPRGSESGFAEQLADMPSRTVAAMLLGPSDSRGWVLLARAAVGVLRRRLPEAFDDVDDVDPGGDGYLRALARAAGRRQLAKAGRRRPAGWYEDACAVSGWQQLPEELRGGTCGAQVWVRRAGVDEAGEPCVVHVRERCRTAAAWVARPGRSATTGVGDGEQRCTRHALRTSRQAGAGHKS